jgi:hypothetical protein
MDPTKKELYTAKRSSGVDCSDPAILLTWNHVKDDLNPTNWLLIGYSDGSTVSLRASGSQGLEELLLNLNNDEAFFGALRAQVRGSTKFYSLSFVGDNLNGMRKGKASMHRSAILNNFETHGAIVLTGISEATLQNIVDQISQQSRESHSEILV